MISISELVQLFFLKFGSEPLHKDEDAPCEVKFGLPTPPTMPEYRYKGDYISESEYNQITKQIRDNRLIEKRKEKREENIAAITRRYEKHEEILDVINQLPEEDKDDVIDFLVSLRKKQRDEFDWENFKNRLIARTEAYLKTQDKIKKF